MREARQAERAILQALKKQEFEVVDSSVMKCYLLGKFTPRKAVVDLTTAWGALQGFWRTTKRPDFATLDPAEGVTFWEVKSISRFSPQGPRPYMYKGDMAQYELSGIRTNMVVVDYRTYSNSFIDEDALNGYYNVTFQVVTPHELLTWSAPACATV